MEVPTIYKAYIMPKFQGISLENMAKNMVLTYLQFRILEISHWFLFALFPSASTTEIGEIGVLCQDGIFGDGYDP